jgi:hypothetical protein
MTTRPWTLPAAGWLGAIEAGGLIAVLGLRGDPGAAFYIMLLAVKFPFCWLVTQRRPSAYLAVLAWELGGMVTATVAYGTPIVLRLAEVIVAAAVTSLLIASTPLFPTVTLPERP